MTQRETRTPRVSKSALSSPKNYRKYTNERTSYRAQLVHVDQNHSSTKRKTRGKRRAEIKEYNEITKGKSRKNGFIMFYVYTVLTRLGQAVEGRGKPKAKSKAVTTLQYIYTFLSVIMNSLRFSSAIFFRVVRLLFQPKILFFIFIFFCFLLNIYFSFLVQQFIFIFSFSSSIKLFLV